MAACYLTEKKSQLKHVKTEMHFQPLIVFNDFQPNIWYLLVYASLVLHVIYAPVSSIC